MIEWLATGVVVPSGSKTVSAGIATEVLLCPKLMVRIDTPSLPRVVDVDTRRLKRTEDSWTVNVALFPKSKVAPLPVIS